MVDAKEIRVFPELRFGCHVSIGKTGGGWRVFYGYDPRETLARALNDGAQLGDDDMGDELWQTRTAPKDGPDDFPTQPWATRAFLHHVMASIAPDRVVWEPTANRGYMVRVLQEKFTNVIGSDAHDYGAGFPVIDFLDGPSPADYGQRVDWIITNPPFNKALDFALRALDVAEEGVALLLRTQWLEGAERYEKLFSKQPPSYVAQYVERVGFDHGVVTTKGNKTVPYCWFIWEKGSDLKWPRVRWVPPCRKDMEMEIDYAQSPI